MSGHREVQAAALDLFRTVLEDDEQHIEDAVGAAIRFAYDAGRKDGEAAALNRTEKS